MVVDPFLSHDRPMPADYGCGLEQSHAGFQGCPPIPRPLVQSDGQHCQRYRLPPRQLGSARLFSLHDPQLLPQ